MEALFSSTVAVGLAEIGDKTQLLSLFLIARYHRAAPIVLGIIIATLLNHWLSALLGEWVARQLPEQWLQRGVGLSFIAIGLWLLIPDRDGDADSRWLRWGPLTATTVLFFLAEIGDKTQVATVVLAAHYESLLAVVAGTTLGMLAANVPVLLGGRWLLERVPLNAVRALSCALFVALGLATLWEW